MALECVPLISEEFCMPKPLVAYVRAISLINEGVGKALVWIVPVIIVVLLYETIVRYVFNNPCTWSTELLEHLMVGGIVLSAGYLLHRGDHVRMDAIYSRWSPKTRAILDIATFFVFIYIFIMAWTFVPSAVKAFNLGQRSVTPWGPPFWPIKTAIAVGAILLVLQGIAVFIRDIAAVLRRPLQ